MASIYERHVDFPTFMEGVQKRNPGQTEYVRPCCDHHFGVVNKT